MRPAAADIARRLGLEPHPEGGWFRETYRAAKTVQTARGTRAASTAILFLITPSSPSRFHRLASDELWVFQAGLPLELVTLEEDGIRGRLLGAASAGDPAAAGLLPQALVPAGVWQAARVAPSPDAPPSAADDASGPPSGARAWSLVSCLVTPGFAFDDFELARRDDLAPRFPDHAELITALT